MYKTKYYSYRILIFEYSNGYPEGKGYELASANLLNLRKEAMSFIKNSVSDLLREDKRENLQRNKNSFSINASLSISGIKHHTDLIKTNGYDKVILTPGYDEKYLSYHLEQLTKSINGEPTEIINIDTYHTSPYSKQLKNYNNELIALLPFANPETESRKDYLGNSYEIITGSYFKQNLIFNEPQVTNLIK